MIRRPKNGRPLAGAHCSAIDPRRISGQALGDLAAVGLTVLRGRAALLRDVDLAIAAGESIAIVGPNGAGKTTLLKCLAGILRPSAGRICWFGDPALRAGEIRRQIGFAGHEPGLYAELTASENLVFAGRMYGIAQPSDRARELLSAAGLSLTSDYLVRSLSHGVRRRLAVGRAIIHEPRLLLLDEPFSGLDKAGLNWLCDLFGQWHKEKRTVCFSSHDEVISSAMADRTVRIEQGRLAVCVPASPVSSPMLRSA